MKPSILGISIALMAEAAAQQSAGSNGSGGKAKAPKFCEKDWDDAFEGNGDALYFNFANGTTLEFHLDKVSSEMQRRLAFHGASQKIGDSFAGVKGNFAEGIQNAQGVIDQLYNNDWAADREGGGPRLGELAAAIARIKNVELEKATAAVEKASKEDREKWRSNAQVKAMVAQIRAEKAQAQLQASQQGGQAQELTVNF